MWQLERHRILKDKCPAIDVGDVVSVEWGWKPIFCLLPHKTISGKWIWMQKIYYRKVWVYTGFIDEPELQYGELFDVLKDTHYVYSYI